jgi:hypothetical protein
MPEYLAPGVFVEEVSFRAKTIEGVATSTTGFCGLTRYGPTPYPGGPSSDEPRAVGSFAEFERVFGGLEPYDHAPTALPYVAHAARAFFANGGQRLYVARVFAPKPGDDWGVASLAINGAAPRASWRARWPGAFGNVIVDCAATRSDNLAFVFPPDPAAPVNRNAWGHQVRGASTGTIVEVTGPTPTGVNARTRPLIANNLFVLVVEPVSGRQTFVPHAGGVGGALGAVAQPDGSLSFPAAVEMRVVEVGVTVQAGGRIDSSPRLAAHFLQPRFAGKVLEKDNPLNEDSIVWLDTDLSELTHVPAIDLLMALVVDPGDPASLRRRFTLTGGHDGLPMAAADLEGAEADPDDNSKHARGLPSLAEIDDIAIVAAPDVGAMTDAVALFTAAQLLVGHAEMCRYRIAVVDGPVQSSLTAIREFRGKFDSTYAALYHPWVEVLDPLSRAGPGGPQNRLLLPPSGFVTGIYARNDVTRGVFKAPANEIVRGLTRFEVNINKARNEILNPEGVNCLRFFEGRGNRVWGARNMTSDSEWRYVNVRRLFIYIEHSIDKASQWVVFEPNNDLLWKRIKRMVEDFLFTLWRDGALLGRSPDEAYFVACDRTTMTQNDLDNGRMICLVGIAPVKPAEFVIFRIGQWTADANA